MVAVDRLQARAHSEALAHPVQAHLVPVQALALALAQAQAQARLVAVLASVLALPQALLPAPVLASPALARLLALVQIPVQALVLALARLRHPVLARPLALALAQVAQAHLVLVLARLVAVLASALALPQALPPAPARVLAPAQAQALPIRARSTPHPAAHQAAHPARLALAGRTTVTQSAPKNSKTALAHLLRRHRARCSKRQTKWNRLRVVFRLSVVAAARFRAMGTLDRPLQFVCVSMIKQLPCRRARPGLPPGAIETALGGFFRSESRIPFAPHSRPWPDNLPANPMSGQGREWGQGKQLSMHDSIAFCVSQW